MKRTALLVVVVLVGVGGYFWYRGDARMWLVSVRDALASKPRESPEGGPAPATARLEEASIAPAVSVLPYREAVRRLAEPSSTSDQIAAWIELTDAFMDNAPGARRREVVDRIREFVGEYVLSGRMPDDPRIAARHNVTHGDSLSAIAARYGTTAEAIARINGLASPTIRPGRTLKVLNQPIALFVDKSEFLLWALYGDKLLCVMECGLGKQNRTPSGLFTIDERIRDPHWFPTDRPSVPPGDPQNLLGSRWLGFRDAEYTGLGIHEARNVADIGKESSNGCIRLAKGDVELIYDLCSAGTPVRISP